MAKKEDISYSYAAAAICALFAVAILILVAIDVYNGRGAQDVILAILGLFFGGLSIAGFKWPDKMAGVFEMLGRMGKNATKSVTDNSTSSTMRDAKANGGSVIVQGPVQGDINVNSPVKAEPTEKKAVVSKPSGKKEAKIKVTFTPPRTYIYSDFTPDIEDTYLLIYNEGDVKATNVRVLIDGKKPSECINLPYTEIIPHHDIIEIAAHDDPYEYIYKEYIPRKMIKNYRIEVFWTDEGSNTEKHYQKDFNRHYC